MKELRASRDGALRVLLMFDPRRQVILLIGGNKAGQWDDWYRGAVPVADALYDDLTELRTGRTDLMAGHRKWADIRGDLERRPGFADRAVTLRAETLEEIRLFELRRAEAVSQVEMAGRLSITQAAISKFEHADDVRVSTLREYLEALGARLELVAVFDDDDRRFPVTLGKDAAA